MLRVSKWGTALHGPGKLAVCIGDDVKKAGMYRHLSSPRMRISSIMSPLVSSSLQVGGWRKLSRRRSWSDVRGAS